VQPEPKLGSTEQVRLRGQSKEKVSLIDATVHELKTSLTAIIVSSELLADELQPNKESITGRLIQSIIRNAHGIDERLSLLSEISRLRDGDFRAQPEPVEIKQVIQGATTQIYPLTQNKKQSLTLDVPGPLPAVSVDRQYIGEILRNLLTNASNFTPERGQITVSVRQDGHNLVVQVKDNGIGIPAEEQEHIFQPYYQVSLGKAQSAEQTSSGLGLAIVKFLVELHGGKVWLKSTVGQGSSFFFSLPLVKSE
jgi:two-component system clock-associated histidine kinase SasA